MIYDYFCAKSERYAHWFSTNKNIDYELAKNLFWVDVYTGTYFRICSHFYITNPESYCIAAQQYIENPANYLTIVQPYLGQFNKLKTEHPELFI